MSPHSAVVAPPPAVLARRPTRRAAAADCRRRSPNLNPGARRWASSRSLEPQRQRHWEQNRAPTRGDRQSAHGSGSVAGPPFSVATTAAAAIAEARKTHGSGGGGCEQLGDEQARLSPSSLATIRRLSWRRQALAKCPDGQSELRRLAHAGRTLSLNDDCGDHNGDHTIGGKPAAISASRAPTRLQAWLQSSDDFAWLLAPPHYNHQPGGVADSATDLGKLCWSKSNRKRGKYGESLVHILIVQQTNEHLLLLVLILHLWPQLVADVFESKKFKGLGCLHLAVAYSCERLLKYLLELMVCARGAESLNEQRVTGCLFRSPAPATTRSGANQRGAHDTTSRLVVQTMPGAATPTPNWPLSRLKRLLRCNGQVGQATAIPCAPAPDTIALGTTGSTSLGGGDGGNTLIYWCDRMSHWPTSNGHTHLILLDRILARDAKPAGAQATAAAANDGDSSQLPIYLGDTPLGWSVNLGARPMCELLIEAGADVNAQDADGNSCLHQLVVNRLTGWTRFLVKAGASEALRNGDGLTPLLLACHLGHHELFNELLELSAVEFWSYSMIRCCGYPLASLDSILATDGQPGGQRSAVAVILESSVSDNEQKAQLLSTEVVKRLLEEKWQKFARRLFRNELLLTLVHLFVLTLAISLRPMATTTTLDRHESQVGHQLNHHSMTAARSAAHTWPPDRQNWIRYLSELASVALSAFQLRRFLSEWRRYGNISLQWTYNPLLPNLVAANGLIVLCAPLRLVAAGFSGARQETGILIGRELARAEDVFLILAAPLLWSVLFFFIAAFRVTGPFVAMIRYMIVRDLRQFSLIYLVFLYSFAQCIFFVNHTPGSAAEERAVDGGGGGGEKEAATSPSTAADHSTDDSSSHLVQLITSYLNLWMELFKMTLGVYDLQPYRHSSLARFFFLLFIYLIPILFNMLIAMMNNTYSLIISQSERAWSFQWARTLFALERRLGPREKADCLRLYSINILATPPTTAAAAAAASADDLNEDEDTSKAAAVAAHSQTNSCSRSVPALLIIKRMSYTRAERRRLIANRWQRSIKSILDDIAKEEEQRRQRRRQRRQRLDADDDS